MDKGKDMWNIMKVDTEELMLGCSVDTPYEALVYLSYYIDHYPQYKFKMVNNAPRITIDADMLQYLDTVGNA